MADPLIGKQIGNYQIIELIGKGGMAAVYKGFQPSMNRNVAIKIMAQQFSGEQSFIQRFENEARLIAQLEHAHILPVYDFGEQEGMLYIVMRLMPTGGTLEDRITEEGMPLNEAVRIFTQIASALDYAHSRGVIHRDLKPANILIDGQGNAFLSDFGIAKSLEEQTGLTGTGGVVGTPTYMSPEQGLGEKLDGRSDIYALGVMLFEMLTGQVPFTADNPMAVMLKHINEPPPDPSAINPRVPDAVSAVVLRALSKNPADRYQTAREMSDALEQALITGSVAPTRAVKPGEAATIPAGAVAPRAATVPAPVAGRPEAVTAVPGQVPVTVPAEQAAGAVVAPAPSALEALGEIRIELNSVSEWLNKHEVVGVWMQAVGLSLVTWLILLRLTQNATLETALLSLIPGVLLYGLLRAPTVGALVSFILILAPLLAHAPGLALIWLVVMIFAGARLNSREIMLILVTTFTAGHPLGLIVPLLSPWWLRVRRVVLPLAVGVILAMLFAFTLRWPDAGGLLPVPSISDEAYRSILFTPFNTTYLGLFENTELWARWADPQALLNVLTATFGLLGRMMGASVTGGMPLVVAAAWAAAATLSVSNQRVNSPVLRALGLLMGFALLMVAHVVFHPAGLSAISGLAIVLAVVSLLVSFLLSQWPIQADPAKGNRVGTTLRMLRQTLGAFFMALGVTFFMGYLSESPTYLVFWIGALIGTLMAITNPLVGPPLVFAALVAGLAPVRPVLSAVTAGVLFVYLIVSLLFDKQRPRRWNPLGAGMILGAPGMAAVGILPLGPLSLGALEAQVPAVLLAATSHVLLIATTEGGRALTFIVQVVTTLAGTLVVERLMGLPLISNLHHKLRRLIFTCAVALLMALSYYTIGQAAPIRLLPQALFLSVLSGAALVAAMGDRAMFWRQFIERKEEEQEAVEDEEVTGPWAAAQRPGSGR